MPTISERLEANNKIRAALFNSLGLPKAVAGETKAAMVSLFRCGSFFHAAVTLALLDLCCNAFISPSASARARFLASPVQKGAAGQGDRCRIHESCLLFATEEGDATAGSATGTENDFRSFLNQCTIQSFMFLLRSTRDPHTIRWLDNFTRPVVDQDYIDAWKSQVDGVGVDGSSYMDNDTAVPSELLRYHGMGAMNMTLFPTWDSFFRGLLQQNQTILEVETNDPRFPIFDIDINPASLCSRILSVREQIAREFEKDLQSIADIGTAMYHSYWHQLEKMREEGLKGDGSGATGNEFERQSLMFLEWDPLYDASAPPSPLRKGNFDLLMLYSTQESIHRLIRGGVHFGDESEAQVRDNTLFLHKFYAERLHSHFAGNQRYSRAEEFLEEMFLADIDGGNDATTLADPLTVAEAIFSEREQVVLEWKEVASVAPDEHMEIRKLQLNRMMGL